MTEEEIKTYEKQMFANFVGCAFRSYNYFHRGLDELVYEAGFKVELEEMGYKVFRQQDFPVYYKGIPTEVNRRMDLVVCDKLLGNVIIELKALDRVGEIQRRQLWTYMKLLNNKYGMLVNFSPNGVYSENWMLGASYDDYCIKI